MYAYHDVEQDSATSTSSSSALAQGGFELAPLWPAAAASGVGGGAGRATAAEGAPWPSDQLALPEDDQ